MRNIGLAFIFDTYENVPPTRSTQVRALLHLEWAYKDLTYFDQVRYLFDLTLQGRK